MELRQVPSRNSAQRAAPLFETSVSAPVKVRGFLRVSPGDIVKVWEIEGGLHGVALVQFGEETGKLPLAALWIDHHCYNTYLQANVKILMNSPSLLHLACAVDDSTADFLIDALSTRPGALLHCLSTLVAIEVSI